MVLPQNGSLEKMDELNCQMRWMENCREDVLRILGDRIWSLEGISQTAWDLYHAWGQYADREWVAELERGETIRDLLGTARFLAAYPGALEAMLAPHREGGWGIHWSPA